MRQNMFCILFELSYWWLPPIPLFLPSSSTNQQNSVKIVHISRRGALGQLTESTALDLEFSGFLLESILNISQNNNRQKEFASSLEFD